MLKKLKNKRGKHTVNDRYALKTPTTMRPLVDLKLREGSTSCPPRISPFTFKRNQRVTSDLARMDRADKRSFLLIFTVFLPMFTVLLLILLYVCSFLGTPSRTQTTVGHRT